MQRNRFFKDTMGRFAELAIVTQVDASDGTGVVAQASQVTLPLTVAGSPTAGDKLTLTFSNGIVVEYTAPATPTTAILNAGVVNAIESALVAAGVVGASVNSTGTTSQVVTISGPLGTSYNGVTITPTETGTSWTVAGAVTFAGGVAGDATAADNIEDFVNNALAGSIWAFWDDTKLALQAGDTFNAANKDRKFFYAWKQGVATEYHKSTAIPVATRKYDSVVYNAGTAQVSTITGGGTFSSGQIYHVRILNTTPTQLPYPSFDYQATIGSGGINQATTDIAALINAEALGNDPIVTAGAGTNVLTITGKDKFSTFKAIAYVEVTTAQPTDATAITLATTTKQKAPIGDPASVTELQQYFLDNNGGVNYPPEGTKQSEFNAVTTNVGTNSVTQFGFLLVKSERTEAGAVRNYSNLVANILIAIKSTDVATLAAL